MCFWLDSGFCSSHQNTQLLSQAGREPGAAIENAEGFAGVSKSHVKA